MEKPILVFPAGAKGIIFDLDGTLIDSMPLHFEGYNYALQPWGVKYPKTTFLSRAGLPSTETMELIRQDFRLKDFDVSVAMKRKREYVDQHLDQISLIKPVFDLVTSQYGKLPLSIGTGSNRKTVNRILKTLNLNQYIEHIVTSDDVTNHKPAPDTFLNCARLMGVRPEDCVVYEDGAMGIQAAKAANMKVVDVNLYL